MLIGAAPRLGAQQATSDTRNAVAISLPEAIRIAESQSEAIRIARAGVMRGTGQQLQARSQRLPQLSGSASYTRTLRSQYSGLFGSPAVDTTKPKAPAPPCDAYLRDATASVTERLIGLENASRCSLGGSSGFSNLPFGQKNQYNVGIAVSQNLFAGGRISALNTAADAGRKSAEIELDAQRAQLHLDVTQAYYDAVLGDRLVAIAESSLVQTQSVLKQTQLSRSVGNVSEFDLLRAQVAAANQQPIAIQRRGDRDVAYFRLKQLLNLPLDEPLALTTSVEDKSSLGFDATTSTVTLGDTAAANRATVREAGEAVRQQRSQLRVAKAQRIPSLSLTSQYGAVAYPVSGFPGAASFRPNWTVGIASQFPLFTGGRIRGEEMVAEAGLRESQARYDQVRKLAALDARIALNAYDQARASWTASVGTAEQAAKAYSIAEVRYREGLSTQLELSDSRILLEQALVNRALSARNLQVARVKLELLPHLPLQSGGSSASAQAASQQQAQSQTKTQTTSQQQPTQTGIPPE
ncbi:MAG: TolC family protein [Gemmatimonadota bacterium]|nr:TolC family protein [Gemmatimonadota bacterium]